MAGRNKLRGDGGRATPKPCIRCGGQCHPNREVCTECWLAEHDPSRETSRAEFGALCAAQGTRQMAVDVRMTYEVLPHESEAALVAELGMPPGIPWLRIGFEGAVYGPKMNAYGLEFFGIPHRISPTPPAGPFVYVQRPTEAGAVACNLQAWQTKVVYAGQRVYGEVRWHPEHGEAISIKGLEHTTEKIAVEHARRGLVLLLGSGALRGRRPGTGTFASENEFRSAVAVAVAGLKKQGRQPTEQNVAQFFRQSPDPNHPSCHVRQLRRWCTGTFGYRSWEHLLADIERELESS